jgi:hypothetical protein
MEYVRRYVLNCSVLFEKIISHPWKHYPRIQIRLFFMYWNVDITQPTSSTAREIYRILQTGPYFTRNRLHFVYILVDLPIFFFL